MTLGEQIKQQREAQNLTQEDLAERLGVSRQAVSKWESNQSQPQGSNRAALCALLSLDLPGEAAPKPRRGLTMAGWVTAAVLLLALAGSWARWNGIPAATDEPATNFALHSIRFYDEDQQEVLPEALWYNTAAIDSILLDWTGGTPELVKVFYTPSGTETAEQMELLLTKAPLDGDLSLLLPANAIHDGKIHGDLSFELTCEGQTIASELYNVFYDPVLLEEMENP